MLELLMKTVRLLQINKRRKYLSDSFLGFWAQLTRSVDVNIGVGIASWLATASGPRHSEGG